MHHIHTYYKATLKSSAQKVFFCCLKYRFIDNTAHEFQYRVTVFKVKQALSLSLEMNFVSQDITINKHELKMVKKGKVNNYRSYSTDR